MSNPYKVGSPLNSQKHHLFYNDGSTSVCGKWLFFGKQYEQDLKNFGTLREDCKGCAKGREKALAKVVKKLAAEIKNTPELA